MKFRSSWIFFVVLGLVLVLGKTNVFAQATRVSTFDELKDAVAQGGEIQVTKEITVTDSLKIQNNVTISGSKLILGNGFTSDQMFEVGKDVSLTLKDITLDGNQKGRLIYSNGGIISLTNGEIQNGFPGDQAKENPGGGIFLRGGSLTATDTKFTGNKPGITEGLEAGKKDKNGGAIYSGSEETDITITGGSFENNEVKAYGHGAAIYQENGSLIVDGTSFKNNKGHVEGGNAGTQGACIHTRDKVKATISGVNAEIARGFNTGGFLRSWKSDVTVTDSTFTIADLGDGYGYSGGALCFEGGTSKVKGSTFTCNESKLIHAGGFIDIVGTGTHVIDGNKMTGAGMDEHKFKAIASFGGAISVEEGANATVTITNNTITDTSASDTGGAIAIGTHKGKSTPSTVTMSGNTITNPGTYYYGAQYGGGVFVAPDATVTMSKDTIKDAKSSYGGGVYNEGKLTITGGSSLTGGVGSKLGGEIYNNGELIVDDATITGNFVGPASWNQTPGHGKGKEYGGINIYAEKDVTITPKAKITTGKDVRVLDGQSKILLTGPLTSEIDVSVSEVAGGKETQNRKVGYVVAAGKDGYQATYSDANFLHYIGRTNKEDANHYSNQPRAEFSDHESLGTWDFVLNPKTKDVVLGQRVKLTLYANGKTETPAKFEDVSADRDDKNGILTKLPSTDIKEDIYDIYASGPKSAILDPVPVRKGYDFTGWYEELRVKDDSPDKDKDGKTLVEDLKLVKDSNEITSIIDPHEYELYAGWEKVVKVKKIWEDNNDEFSNRPDNIKVKLYSGNTPVASEIELNAGNNWQGEFRNIRRPKIVRTYTVKEFPGQVTGYKTGEVTGNDIDGFTVTNETEYITIEGSKTWEHGENLVDKQPTSVTVKLSDGTKEETKTVGANENWTWKFENLPKYKNKTLVNYTLTENPVDHYTSTKSEDGYSFINTFTNKYKVTYKFVPEDTSKTLPQGVMTQLPAEQKDKENNTKVTPSKSTFTDVTTEDGIWSFVSWNPTEQTINGSDVKFVGTWKFTENKYKVTYKFESGTKGKELPTEVTKLLPKDSKEYDDNTDVTPETLNTTEVTVTGGKWAFKGWTPATATIDKADVEFVGKWEFEADPPVPEEKYKVTYKFESGTKGKELPTEVTDLLPTDSKEYEDKTAVTPITLDTKEVIVTGGKWIFKEWTPPKATINNKDVEFVGKWEFKADEPTPVEKIITEYVDTHGRELLPSKDGNQPKESIPGYEYIKTEKTLEKTTEGTKTTIRHIYKKLVKDGPPKITFWAYPTEPEPVSDKGLLNKEDHKAYMFGYDDGNFGPEDNMTREEVTAMFARLLKDYPRDRRSYQMPYSDVSKKNWSYEAIGFMTEKGMVKGYQDGSFRPKAPVTRAEFAAMASRFDRLMGGQDRGFKDVKSSHWAFEAINSAAAKGWVKGYPDRTFKPDQKITRSEVVSITNIMLDRYADKDFVRKNIQDMIYFKDLTEANWAYFPIMEATHGHDYTRKALQEENWIRLNGEEFCFPLLYRK